MTTVNTPMAARGLRADVAGTAFGFMVNSFGAVPLNAIIAPDEDIAIETRDFLVDGQRVTIRITVEPIVSNPL